MRLVIQRAAQASVTVDGMLVSEIGRGIFAATVCDKDNTESPALPVCQRV